MYILLSSLLVFGTLFVYYASSILFKKNPIDSSQRLPPGNLGWPIIGESLAFSSTMRNGCPQKFVGDRMKKYAPTQVFKTSMLGEKMSILYGAAGNKLLFSNENKLVTTWWPSSTATILSSGPNFRNLTNILRMSLLEFVKPEALQQYVSTIQFTVHDHLQREWIPNKGEVIVFPLLKKLTFALGCQIFVGMVNPEQVGKLSDLFVDTVTGIFSLPIDFPGTAYNRAMKSAARIRNALVPIIRQKRNQLMSDESTVQKKRDLFSQLLRQTDEEGKLLSEMDIANQILSLLIASHDTTSSTMTSVVYFLADHPHSYARVLEEQMEIANSKGANVPLTWEDIQKMKHSWNVASEALRIASHPGNFKEVLADFSFGGCLIPKGSKIFLSTHATHNNPECFPNPEQFDPSRFEGNGPLPYTFVPFGGGPKMCPGREFARIEILIFMHCLVTKFRWEKLFTDEKLTYNPVPIPVKGLPIRLLPHET